MRPQPRVFYGWIIVLISALGLFLGAPVAVFSFGIFFKPLVEDFHASRAAVSLVFSIANFVGALSLPLTGILIDRFSPKRVILISTVLFGAVLCSALLVGTGLWQLYVLFSLLGVTMSGGPAPVPYTAVITHWFDRRRGFALALCMMGIGIGAIVVPMLSQRLISAYNWRVALAIFGAAVLLVPSPAIAIFLKNDPAQLGLHPDGDILATAPRSHRQNTVGLSWHEIWHSPTYWLLLCIFVLVGVAMHGSVLHLAAILTDRGITAQRAALATSVVGAAVLIGRIGSGYLMDFFFAPRVAMLFFGASTLGIAILCTSADGVLTLPASFLIGLGTGAEVETLGYMISRYFGLRCFGTAYGIAFGAFMTAGSAGVLLMGAGYDHFHSYTVTLIALAAAMLAAVLLLMLLGPYRFAPESRADAPHEPLELPHPA
ncbi:MAG TPA: MFS transporter [Acidobacteriaceae bacterium]|nr:MFS transporter [Acidobacteriaceae bacterium]